MSQGVGLASCLPKTAWPPTFEPLPGRYPSSLGPLPLLKESRLNHMAKLAFQSIYWHMLLPGREIPGISTQMQMHGKRTPVPAGAGREE